MRPLSLWRHEIRRAGLAALLTPPVVALIVGLVAVDGAVRLDQPSRDTARILQSLLEVALPLVAGVGAASLIGRDPAVELQLTVPTAYRGTILRRLAAATGWVALISLAAAVALIATGWWHRWPTAHSALAGQLTWLAPTVFLAALGLLVGALSGGPAVATSAVALLWMFQLAGRQVLRGLRRARGAAGADLLRCRGGVRGLARPAVRVVVGPGGLRRRRAPAAAARRGAGVPGAAVDAHTAVPGAGRGHLVLGRGDEVDSEFPSLANTVLSLTMDYPLAVFFGSDSASAGPAPGAPLNFLRPAPTTATAVLSLVLMLGIAAIVAAARALNTRTAE